MYFARGNQVFYFHPVNATEQLFLTVHSTEDSALTVEQQAEFLANLLTNLPVTRQADENIF